MPLTQLVVTLGLPTADLALLHRARYDGLTSIAADRISCALGFHPSLVWGIDWWDGAEPASTWADHGGDAA